MVEVSIRYGQDIIGSLAVDRPTITAAQRRHLLQHIADSLAVVVEANRTSVDVERQLREALAHADDIAVARRSLVADMERERRRIERDLHDGVQGHLVSLAALIALVDHQVRAGQLPAARERLGQIAAYLDVTESILDQTVQGVSHPLHGPHRPRNRPGEHHEHGEHGEPGQHSDPSEHSLIAALRHAVADGHPAVAIDVDLGVDVAIAPPIAATIYYCCLEAINNARRHAQPDTIALRISGSDGRLRFTVTDDGIGYDASAHQQVFSGRGLRNVRARLSSVGGHLDIHSQPGRGTTVDAAVPLTPAPIGPADDAAPDVGSPLGPPDCRTSSVTATAENHTAISRPSA
jgi:signal transduction histidine kinase